MNKTPPRRLTNWFPEVIGFKCITLNAWSLERTENLIASVTAGIQDEIQKAGRGRSWGVRQLSKFVSDALLSLIPNSLGGQMVRGLVNTKEKSEGISADIYEVASIASTHRSFADLIDVLLSESSSRLLVLIDDLDRALPDQITAMLRNLKLVLEVPRCVFLLAMDMNIVAQAVENFYRSQVPAHALAEWKSAGVASSFGIDTGGFTTVPAGFGMNYLEKLVQIRVPVPTMARDVAVDFARANNLAPEIVEIVSLAPAEEISNPRRLKRYVNWLSVTLQQILCSDLPEGIDNLFALRSLALGKHYRAVYDSMVSDPGFPATWLRDSANPPFKNQPTWRSKFMQFLEQLAIQPIRLAKFDDFVKSANFTTG